MRRLSLHNLRGDLFGGITAAVVALPLALGFGVASGAGPEAGVYGAIWVGLLAALFGGTPAQISGPTGPMTVVMAAILTQFADRPAQAFTVVMLAGLLQIAFGALHLGRYIRLMPYPVISGFMSGIGCIIIIIQLAPLLGAAESPGKPIAALGYLPEAVAGTSIDALAVGIIAFAITTFLPARIGRWLPGPLAALLIGTLLVSSVFTDASVLGAIPAGLPTPMLPSVELATLPYLIKSALVLALLGSIDSLLTSLIADNITQGHHDSDRELVGQGIGNAVAGLMGGIPGAGATMRTVVNVRVGGRTPISGVVHALILLAVMLGLGPLASHVPHAVLAGILVKVGIDIIDWDYIRRAPHAPRAGVVMMFTVLALTVLTDLVTAVTVGVVMASLLFVKRMAELQVEGVSTILGDDEAHDLTDEERGALARHEGRVALVRLRGPMSFGAANELARRVIGTGEYQCLLVDFTDVPFIDSSASMAVETVIAHARSEGKEVLLVGLQPAVTRTLTRVGVLKKLGPGRRLRRRLAAIERADELLAERGGGSSTGD